GAPTVEASPSAPATRPGLGRGPARALRGAQDRELRDRQVAAAGRAPSGLPSRGRFPGSRLTRSRRDSARAPQARAYLLPAVARQLLLREEPHRWPAFGGARRPPGPGCGQSRGQRQDQGQGQGPEGLFIRKGLWPINPELLRQIPALVSLQKSALIVQGPQEVKKRELVFLQFRLNQSSEDFSAIDYLLFSSFREFLQSPDKVGFMQACESAYSSWKFSGGFRTWVKMSLVKTKEEDGREAVEFRQETSVVNYIDQRPATEKSAQLFFVVFEWKDPFIQKVQDIITANPWNTIALLCGAFLALFKAAEFAKLSVKWMIKIRKRYLKRRGQATNHIS
uniref:Proton-activated chloride channel n=1 Tax=Oryctolagus cuniculus TaxID=9986 RepID=A0A5F9DF71_RABIT